MKTTTKYFLTFLTTMLFALVSYSCDCIITPIEDHIQKTKFIITGQVVNLLDTKDEGHFFQSFDSTKSYKVKIKIIESFKGGLDDGHIIEIGSDYSNCSFYFGADEKYLLFLNKVGDKYFQKGCSYSERLDKADKNISTIKKLTAYKSKK